MKRMGAILIFLPLLLAACVSMPARLGFSQEEWQSFSKPHQQQLIAGYHATQKAAKQKSAVYAGPHLSIYIADGQARMPASASQESIQTAYFRLQPGACQLVNLRAIDTNDSVPLKVCYNGLTLSLDPSRYRVSGAKGTIHLNYSPLWKQGFTYAGINSTGFVRLRHVNLTIKALPNVVEVSHAKLARD